MYRAGDKKDWKDFRDDLIGTALFGAGRVATGVARARTAAEAGKETVDASRTIARAGAEIEEAERTGQAVDSSVLIHLDTAQVNIRRSSEITESSRQGHEQVLVEGERSAFRHLDLEAPGEKALSIDRFARFAAGPLT